MKTYTPIELMDLNEELLKFLKYNNFNSIEDILNSPIMDIYKIFKERWLI